jgi:hypothetical protein
MHLVKAVQMMRAGLEGRTVAPAIAGTTTATRLPRRAARPQQRGRVLEGARGVELLGEVLDRGLLRGALPLRRSGPLHRRYRADIHAAAERLCSGQPLRNVSP